MCQVALLQQTIRSFVRDRAARRVQVAARKAIATRPERLKTLVRFVVSLNHYIFIFDHSLIRISGIPAPFLTGGGGVCRRSSQLQGGRFSGNEPTPVPLPHCCMLSSRWVYGLLYSPIRCSSPHALLPYVDVTKVAFHPWNKSCLLIGY